jgi:glycosyltransferase involved in cell wall biosynthesis
VERVSVVISTYSKKNLWQILTCIDSLRKQSFHPHEILLVVDPDPDEISYFKYNSPRDVKVVESSGFGLSNARNTGTRVAAGEIVAFIDDDAFADENWLRNIAKDFEDSSVMGVGGPIKPFWGGKKPSWFPEELNWIIGCSYRGGPKRREEIRNPIGCNMSFRKSALEKAGYFRSDLGRFGKFLFAGEESDVSLRIKHKIPGARIINEPSAVVFHSVNVNRMKLKYILVRSFYEGVSKSLISSSTFDQSKDLTTERSYLKFILRASVLPRLKEIYKFRNLGQLTLILSSSYAVFVGYALGRITRRDGSLVD